MLCCNLSKRKSWSRRREKQCRPQFKPTDEFRRVLSVTSEDLNSTRGAFISQPTQSGQTKTRKKKQQKEDKYSWRENSFVIPFNNGEIGPWTFYSQLLVRKS